jgi:hypothetical protein
MTSFNYTKIQIINGGIYFRCSKALLSWGVQRASFISVLALPSDVTVFTDMSQYFAVLSSA